MRKRLSLELCLHVSYDIVTSVGFMRWCTNSHVYYNNYFISVHVWKAFEAMFKIVIKSQVVEIIIFIYVLYVFIITIAIRTLKLYICY
jgi:homospermidine synthase